MGKGSIKLHPEHGVNPTIALCFVCGKEKNEIALLGAAYKGHAPMHMVINIDPCDVCRKKYLSIGVLIVEATEGGKQPTPTGRLTILKDEAFSRIFTIEIPKRKIVFCEPEAFEKVFGEVE